MVKSASFHHLESGFVAVYIESILHQMRRFSWSLCSGTMILKATCRNRRASTKNQSHGVMALLVSLRHCQVSSCETQFCQSYQVGVFIVQAVVQAKLVLTRDQTKRQLFFLYTRFIEDCQYENRRNQGNGASRNTKIALHDATREGKKPGLDARIVDTSCVCSQNRTEETRSNISSSTDGRAQPKRKGGRCIVMMDRCHQKRVCKEKRIIFHKDTVVRIMTNLLPETTDGQASCVAMMVGCDS
jgi:hypothetical protein